jgi:hypothetical protein
LPNIWTAVMFPCYFESFNLFVYYLLEFIAAGQKLCILKLVFVIRFTNLILIWKTFWNYKNYEKCLQNNIFFSFSRLIILITSYRLLKSGYKYPAIYIQNPLNIYVTYVSYHGVCLVNSKVLFAWQYFENP